MKHYLVKGIKRVGVKISNREEVESDTIERLKPDTFIVAVGGKLIAPSTRGIELTTLS